MPYGTRILVEQLSDNEPGAKAGLQAMDEIVSVDGVKVDGQKKFVEYIRSHTGKPVKVAVSRKGTMMDFTIIPREKESLSVKLVDAAKKDSFVLATDNMSIVKDGIKKGTVKLNGSAVKSFDDFTAMLSKNAGKEIVLDNAGGSYKGIVEYSKRGFIGVMTGVAPEMVEIHHGVVRAVLKGVTDPVDFIVMNLKGLGMLVSGKLNVRENVSGPIRIAKIAGDTVNYRGISAFVVLMAKISIILMVMNLLPLPAVDGSFIIFFTVEWIRGRALNEKLMERIQLFGFIFLILLSVFVVFNDLTFMPFFQKIMAFFR
jgi:regulator of sigma E protease